MTLSEFLKDESYILCIHYNFKIHSYIYIYICIHYNFKTYIYIYIYIFIILSLSIKVFLAILGYNFDAIAEQFGRTSDYTMH